MNLKFLGKFNVPTPAEIVAGLDVDSDPAVVTARRTLVDERAAADQAHAWLSDARTAVSDVKAAVAAGQVRLAKLEAALVAERAAALVLPQHGPRVADAERAVERAIVDARANVVAECGKRRDRLQRVAEELTPTLAALREAEAALDVAVHAVKPGATVRPLEWPSTVEDECAQRNAAFSAANFAAGAR